MAVGAVGDNSGRGYSGFVPSHVLREHPEFIPEPVPASEKGRTDKLADGRCDTDQFKAVQNKIVQYEIDQRYEDVAAGDLGLVAFE